MWLYRRKLFNAYGHPANFVIVAAEIFNLSREFVKQRDQRAFWFYVGKLLIEFNNPARFGGHRHCGSGDSVFNLSWGLTWPHVQRVMEICGWKFLIVNHHLPKFGGHRPFRSRDIRNLMFYMTLQHYMLRGLYEFMEGNSTLYMPTLSW